MDSEIYRSFLCFGLFVVQPLPFQLSGGGRLTRISNNIYSSIGQDHGKLFYFGEGGASG
jgi:hypothetical protein